MNENLIFHCIKKNKKLSDKFKDLDDREIRLLDLALFGMNNKEIAATVYMSEANVKAKFSGIFLKTGLKNKFRIFSFIIEVLQES